MSQHVKLQKGVFIISLDTELAWGTRGHAAYADDYDRTRETIRQVLLLCERYQIKATWAIVGHLFLKSCSPQQGVVHPEIHRPHAGKVDEWFAVDPSSTVDAAPWWYGPDVVERIKNCRVPQEIGSHSFSHLTQEPWCDAACFASELQASLRVMQEWGLERPTSFVFPRNIVKHLDVLAEHGFTSYRGVDETWYEHLPKPVRRIAHGLDSYLNPSAPTTLPSREEKILNIPGTYYYVHRRGWASLLPISFRTRKALYGIRRAADRKEIFHLWCHPFNIASDPTGLLSGLEEIFRHVAELREQGVLAQMTMRELTNHTTG